MAGHRRISTDLFLKYRRRSREDAREATPIEALLELDLDDWRGRFGPDGPAVKTYARFWGWTPGRTRRLITEWNAHRADRANVEKAYPRRTPGVPSAYPQADPQDLTNSGRYETSPDPLADPSRTPGGPSADPILEPEPKPERERVPAPRSPAAISGTKRVGPSVSRRREAQTEIDLALAKAPESDRGPIAVRLEILQDTFLACGRIADEGQLRGYCRTTFGLPPVILKAACDAARTLPANDRGFPPSETSILAEGKKIATRARKRERGGAVCGERVEY